MSKLKSIPSDKIHDLTLKILDIHNFDNSSDIKELADSYFDKYVEVYNHLCDKSDALKAENTEPSKGYNIQKNKEPIF